ncbi:hypothetical protein OCU04_000229 [Sclerotinia nivalis]|uniref:BZIP domain-containing protein n=1 Tax=Sclerotinia nivalis TaxID=352851 RepID=A0A9X0DNJ0_9HELO|nr:hypothetical protein OCU04_000229 [Sclerotinia nivalis]
MASQLQFIEPAGTITKSTIESDFVLFETRTPNVHRTPSLSNTPSFTGQNRRHSSNLVSASPLLQNQRVAAIIQSTGHPSTSAFTNRFNSPAQLVPHQHFYASAPASPATLQQPQRSRPQVPLFSQSTGSISRNSNMALQDMDLFDEFTPFEGGTSTQNSYSSAFSSPAVATMYDPTNNLSSSSSTNMGFVSPQDLSLRDSFASAPNSAAFTNLTTPSTYNESPAFEQYDDSPFVSHGSLNDNNAVQGDPWFSLFPDVDNIEQPNATNSPLAVEEELEVSDQLNEKKDNRRKSGSATSPMSATSGVRKPSKALPPIIVDNPNDTVAMKRARNTLAARKSRQRKMQRFEELEDQIAKLTAERDHWKEKALRRSNAQ